MTMTDGFFMSPEQAKTFRELTGEPAIVVVPPYAFDCPVCVGLDYPGLVHNPESPYCSEFIGKPCTCTVACIPESITPDQFCRESESCREV